MTEKREILCDGPKCGKDVAYTGNSVDYRIVLGNQSKTPWYIREGKTGGAVTDMIVCPPIENGPKHFCGPRCLKAWVIENIRN